MSTRRCRPVSSAQFAPVSFIDRRRVTSNAGCVPEQDVPPDGVALVVSVAIDIAMLLPPATRAEIVRLNARFPNAGDNGFRFDATHHPHLTLGQHFIDATRLDAVCATVETVLSKHIPLTLQVTGTRSGRTAQVLTVSPTSALQALHEHLLDALEPFEVIGTMGSFQSDDHPPRTADVAWVTQFRLDSSYARFAPHITVGIGSVPVPTTPFEFTGHEIAVFRLGRFCTCRDQLKRWTL